MQQLILGKKRAINTHQLLFRNSISKISKTHVSIIFPRHFTKFFTQIPLNTSLESHHSIHLANSTNKHGKLQVSRLKYCVQSLLSLRLGGPTGFDFQSTPMVMWELHTQYNPWDWYIYLHLVSFGWLLCNNVGKYSIHGSYWIGLKGKQNIFW